MFGEGNAMPLLHHLHHMICEQPSRPANALADRPAPAVGGPYAYYVLESVARRLYFRFHRPPDSGDPARTDEQDLKVSDTALGVPDGFAFAVFYTFAGLPLARMADRWVRRSLIAVAWRPGASWPRVSGLARNFTDLASRASVWASVRLGPRRRSIAPV